MTLPPELMDPRDAGQILKQARKARGLTQGQVIEAVGIPNQSYLSALENGRYNVANSEYFPALAQLLRLTVEQVRAINPSAVITVSSEPSPRSGPLVKPRLPEVEVRLEVPSGLQEAIEKYGDDYPELHLEANQRALTSLHRYGGANDLSSKEWFEVFMANRRWLVRADDRN